MSRYSTTLIFMFRQTKRRVAGRRHFENVAAYAESAVYPSRLSFYDTPPLQEITLEQFETWAIDRLRVLIEIESCLARGKSVRDMEGIVRPLLLKHLPSSDVDERRKDHYSHYTLRLVFCRTDELRRRFVRAETALFRLRYNMLQPKEQHEFVRLNADKLHWEYILAEEKSALAEALYSALGTAVRALLADSGEPPLLAEHLRAHMRAESYIRLPFEKVGALVALRLVYVSRGRAYVPAALQLSLLAAEFSSLLSNALMKTFQALPRLEEDDRVLPLLSNLSRSFASVQYDATETEGLSAAQVTLPDVTQHYPLCASHLQSTLVAQSHLKYIGRQQLGLFLKGAGLGVDEALRFWAGQFTKLGTINQDTFNKEYRYNIRHMYGLEGGRINYKPWDCNTILLKPKPLRGEAHGCPYRDFSPDALAERVASMGVAQHDVQGVLDHVARHEYTVACTRVFELTHKVDENLHITHPNLYFDRSRQLSKKEART